MAGKRSSPRKRHLSEPEDETPAKKRVNIEAKSPKTAIRDASEALIEAIKQAEEAYIQSKKNDSKRSQKMDPKVGPRKGGKAVPASGDFEFEKDKGSGLPYVYIVLLSIAPKSWAKKSSVLTLPSMMPTILFVTIVQFSLSETIRTPFWRQSVPMGVSRRVMKMRVEMERS